MEKKEYVVADLKDRVISPEELLSHAYDDDIKKRLEKVISIEGPIKESLLIKRVLNSYSLYKNGSRIEPHLSPILTSLSFPTTVDKDGERVYHTGKSEDYFRPTPLSSVRYSYQIPEKEAANAILYILEKGDKNSYTKSTLYRLFLSEMEYLKSGDRIVELFNAALMDERIKISGNGRIIK